MNDIIYDWRDLGLKGLDTILCAGESRMSKAIYKMQKFAGANEEDARITHVAGIETCPWGDTVYVQESTIGNKWAGKSGVQINPMDKWLSNYKGRVYARKMDFTRSVSFYAKEACFWEQHKNDPYESGIAGGLELLLCAMRLHRYIPWYTPMETKEIHCSELMAKRIDAHKLWEIQISANRMPPHIWCSEIDEYLRCDISEMIRIK